MIRIISGKHKNRKLETKLKDSKGVEYRPASDKTRQAMFNIINNAEFIPEHFLQDTIVADICCGSGSFGLEALSRGAKFSIFIDKAPEQIRLVRHNAEVLGEQANSAFLTMDATKLPPARQKCNILYIDPPYGSKLIDDILKTLVKNNWLAEHNLIIIESGIRDIIVMPEKFEQLDKREYGITKLTFCAYHA